ncbi:hypothetical protein U9M48_005826 [Paspalum notatum var. saurae]|uniref:NAB domain-containing protein n=1 Tax=Paspalum notatum var. saurae TaxID=547442 RepID=A0AAQ3PWI6_PASNO
MESQQQQEESPVGACCLRRPPTCPPWLQAAIADIEQRVRALAVDEAPPTEHSFADRAESYYQQRPQLLALLADLHHRYVCLAQRYAHAISLLHSSSANNNDDIDTKQHASSDDDCCSSDADSSLSFQVIQSQLQQPPPPGISSSSTTTTTTTDADIDLVLAELVLAWVRRDVLADEAERRAAEAARRIELQGSLVEVLESERLVLLGENARLGLRASAAEDGAAAAQAELGYARRRAADLARLVVKLREDHRVCALGRRIEALQAHVYGLELRNRECYDAMAAWDAERKAAAAEIQRLRADNARLLAAAADSGRKRPPGKGKGAAGWGWWARVRMAAEWTPCAPPAATTVRKVGEQMKGGKDVGGNASYSYGGCFCV